MKFIKLTHQFQQVRRAVLVNFEDRFENDLEHSGQLALAAWYIINTNNLKLNHLKIFKYALAHDLVEIYAGDINFYNLKQRKNKQELEAKSAKRIAQEIVEFKDLHKIIQSYERRKDPESKFVYALDKILPVLNIYLDKGRTWKKDKITLEMLIKYKTKAVSVFPDVQKYFNQLIRILKKHKSYFTS